MRSVVVVFPASMCAMMPMLRALVRSVSTSFCATEVFPLFRLLVRRCQLRPATLPMSPHAAPRAAPHLPAIMRKGAVCLGHLVGVLTSLDGGPEAVAGIHDLVCQALDHRLFPALPGEAHHTPQGGRGRPLRTRLDGHLVGGTANAAAAHLQ